MCNKVSYENKALVVKDADFIYVNNRRNSAKATKMGRPSPNSRLKPYFCTSCNKWHLTSLSKNITKRFANRGKHERSRQIEQH